MRLILMTEPRWIATTLAAMTALVALAAGCASATSATELRVSNGN